MREREKLFERGCQEEQVNEADIKLLEEIKTKKSAPRQAEQKKVQVEEEFPTIWNISWFITMANLYLFNKSFNMNYFSHFYCFLKIYSKNIWNMNPN